MALLLRFLVLQSESHYLILTPIASSTSRIEVSCSTTVGFLPALGFLARNDFFVDCLAFNRIEISRNHASHKVGYVTRGI